MAALTAGNVDLARGLLQEGGFHLAAATAESGLAAPHIAISASADDSM